jgi:ABC-type polysaccharide/polyol phosphate export permease
MLSLLSNDILEFIGTCKPAFFWLSGILFNSRKSDNIFFVLNPITFLVESYRNSLCYNMWLWGSTRALAGFAAVYGLLALITVLVYKKLKYRLPELI